MDEELEGELYEQYYAEEFKQEEPWGCPVCGKRIHITGTTTNGRLIGSCNDAFTLDFFLQQTRDYLLHRVEALVEDGIEENEDEWRELEDVFTELGLKLQPVAKAKEIDSGQVGVFVLQSFDQIKG